MLVLFGHQSGAAEVLRAAINTSITYYESIEEAAWTSLAYMGTRVIACGDAAIVHDDNHKGLLFGLKIVERDIWYAPT